MQRPTTAAFTFLFVASVVYTPSVADIFRWDNNQLIPGTEGIDPGPGINLSERDLAFANLRDQDLTSANLEWAVLTNADLEGTVLRSAALNRSDLAHAKLEGAE